MVTTLFEWLINIPSVVAQFGNWLITPLDSTYLNISPLALFGIGGATIIITIIGIHIVRLFV